jgi:hypothetical protein
MSRRDGLAVYVTSHGYGHLNRTAAVLNRLPFELPVTIRCAPDLFDHWRERLLRPADLEPYLSDSGAVNPPGDSAATDGPATIERALRVHAQAMDWIDEEVARLREGGFAAVLADIPAVPLAAAARAGIPAFGLGNFTWSEIYAEHAERMGPEARELVTDLRRRYGEATAAFRAEPALPMAEFRRRIDVGMVVTPGRDRRAELVERLGIEPGARLVYFYVGRYGQADLRWDRLAAMRGVHFVGFHPPPGASPPNLHVVPADAWTGADLAASCDVAVAKAGYGSVCETMAAGTPLVYPPREGFAEHAVLDAAMRAWGGGVPATARQFAELDLVPLLERAFALRPGSPPLYTGGAARVADHLTRVCGERR